MELFYNLFLIVNDICSRYVLQYKDGNPANLHYKNLELKQLKQVARHTCPASVKLTNGLKITSKGEVFYGSVAKRCGSAKYLQ